MHTSIYTFFILLSVGICLGATGFHPPPAYHPPVHPPEYHPPPRPVYNPVSRPHPYTSSSTNWLLIYVILSHNSQHHYIEERGQFNNITLVSNCSEIVNVTLNLSGENETISLIPNEVLSIYVNDSTCQNFTGFHLYQPREYNNCIVTVDYSFIPCDAAYGIFIAGVVLLAALLTFILICGIAICVRTYRKRADYNNMV